MASFRFNTAVVFAASTGGSKRPDSQLPDGIIYLDVMRGGRKVTDGTLRDGDTATVKEADGSTIVTGLTYVGFHSVSSNAYPVFKAGEAPNEVHYIFGTDLSTVDANPFTEPTTVPAYPASGVDNSGDNVFTADASGGALEGGGGNDTLIAGDSADSLYGGSTTSDAGIDTASYAMSDEGVAVNLGDSDAETGGYAAGDVLSGVENLIGSAHKDTLTGDSGDNVIEGGAGGDDITGGAGTDTASYAGSSAAVTVNLATGRGSGGDAGDPDNAAVGVDTLTSIENLIGSAHNDSLTGDGGANVLEGGAGADTLTGGGGADRFIVNFGAGESPFQADDRITDFEQGSDKIRRKCCS